MSLHIDAAARAVVQRAANDARETYEPWDSTRYRSIIEACVAAETAEARATIAELRLKVLQLETENQRLKPTVIS